MNSAHSMSLMPHRLGFRESVVRCLRKYATFRGRATRAEYWWFSLFNGLLGLTVYAVFQHWMGTEAADEALGIVQFALFLPSLAVGVRRLHDIDFRGWWILLSLTIVGIIPLFLFFCLPGRAMNNRFGAREDGTGAETEQKKLSGNGETHTYNSTLLCLCCLSWLSCPLFMAETATGAESASPPVSDSTSFGAISRQDVEQSLQEAFGGMFSIMGEAIGGLTKGMQEGVRDIQARLDGADGTRVIANKEDLSALTETSILRVEQLEDRSWRIILAVKNPQEFPVRLTGLTDKQQVLLLDQKGFVHEQKSVGERVVTVPERATQKVEFIFPELDESTPKILRLYSMDFPIGGIHS